MVFFLQSAYANIGPVPKPRSGNIVGDSYLMNISITKEELFIDLSNIDKGLPVKVRARYFFECSELIKPMNLIFVANNLTESRFKVELDGDFVNGSLSDLDSIPKNWFPPDSVQWDGRKIPFSYRTTGLIQFQFDSLTSGKHELVVDYDADASEWFSEEELIKIRTFVYILKPTDQWKRFEKFHLMVKVPKDWELTSNLDLEDNHSNVYTGKWEELPDELLTIAIRKSPNRAWIYSILFLLGSSACYIIIILIWITKVRRLLVNGRISWVLKALNNLLIGIITSGFFFIIYFKNQNLLQYWLDDHMSPLIFYGSGYYILLFPIVCIIICIIVFITDYFLTNRLAEKRKLKRK